MHTHIDMHMYTHKHEHIHNLKKGNSFIYGDAGDGCRCLVIETEDVHPGHTQKTLCVDSSVFAIHVTVSWFASYLCSLAAVGVVLFTPGVFRSDAVLVTHTWEEVPGTALPVGLSPGASQSPKTVLQIPFFLFSSRVP